MEFSSVLASRNSVRAFKDTAVPEALLEELLGQALQAPSWSNTQPYHVAVARGPVLADLREALGERFRRASKLSRAPWYAKLLAPFSGALPDGDFKPKKLIKKLKPPKGEFYFAAESARGHFGMYMVSDGGDVPSKLKLRTPSFSVLSSMPTVLEGTMVADTIAILGSIDIVLPEVDR